jgi:hypothetical protein
MIAPDFLAAKLIHRFLGYIFAPSLESSTDHPAGKEI